MRTRRVPARRILSGAGAVPKRSMRKRAVAIVIDGVGVGALPDAARYGDCGANSLENTARSVGGLCLPTLAAMGLGCVASIRGVEPALHPTASFGRMAEVSPGKDSTTGHWELMGCPLAEPFPLYPDGFPPEIISAFEALIGRSVLGNRAASGTAVIEELGAEHLATGGVIVYTSADSVFQLAAHEAVMARAMTLEDKGDYDGAVKALQEAAAILGIDQATLWRRRKAYGI